VSCPHCGAPIEPGERFCGECGRPLGGNRDSPLRRAGAGSRPKRRRDSGSTSSVSGARTSENLDAGERKIVTAVFADIKGSMELMQDRDPEEARSIIDPALQLMIAAVRHYDGHVVQSTGDGIFALFGAPLAHEDHPQRALYAALRLQNAIRGYSAKLVADGGTPLEARVGVNSGEVVVRTLATADGHAEYTPIGHTANLASRMEAIAPTGSIAITEHTRRLVEGFFQLKSHGPTRVKGLFDSINVYEVTGLGPLRTRLQQAAARGLSKFVGREREMDAIRHALEQAKTGHGQIVAAIAEAGVGKSRLFYEFKATSQSGCTVLEALSISHGKASAYLPVIDLLRSYFRIANEDDERARREKVAGKVTMLDRSLEDTLPYLFNLLGIVNSDDPLVQMDGQVKKRRTLEAIKRILLRESLNQALIVFFEDLHWIDEQTQELLNLLADSIGTSKILLLVNYRPEYRHEWTHKTYYTQLRLDPLAKENAREMLTALIGPGSELSPLKRLIIDRTEGNPFFMEEIVQALFEEGALVRNGEIKLTRSLNEVRIPATVQVILTARIDRLPQPEKELLQTVAVLGKEFTLSLVRATATAIGAELEQSLACLQSAEFIYEQPAMGDTEYTFKHALTQEAAYNSILVDRRKQIHERAAQTIETLHAGERSEIVDELARHYGRSGNVPKAIEYLQHSGDLALARSSFDQAVANLSSALELIPALPPGEERARREVALQVALGSACMGSGWGSERREAAYRRAVELCQQMEGDRDLFPVLWNLCQLKIQRGELQRLVNWLTRDSAWPSVFKTPLSFSLLITISASFTCGGASSARLWRISSVPSASTILKFTLCLRRSTVSTCSQTCLASRRWSNICSVSPTNLLSARGWHSNTRIPCPIRSAGCFCLQHWGGP
jgi:class 3 adenylate cyclase